MISEKGFHKMKSNEVDYIIRAVCTDGLSARYSRDNPETIIAGSAAAVILCMFIVVAMVMLLIKR